MHAFIHSFEVNQLESINHSDNVGSHLPIYLTLPYLTLPYLTLSIYLFRVPRYPFPWYVPVTVHIEHSHRGHSQIQDVRYREGIEGSLVLYVKVGFFISYILYLISHISYFSSTLHYTSTLTI